MKKFIFFMHIVFLLGLTGCREVKTLTADINIRKASPSSVIATTTTPITNTPSASHITSRQTSVSTSTTVPIKTIIPTKLSTPTITETSTPKQSVTPSISSNTQLEFRCMDVVSTLPREAVSGSTIILDSRVILDNGRYSPDTFLFNLMSGKTSQINLQNENQIYHVVSPNGKNYAYHSVVFDLDGNVKKEELVIANSDGTKQKAIPWEKDWLSMPHWLDNKRLAVSFYPNRDTSQKAASILVWNIDNNERLILSPNFPLLLNKSWITLPDWDGWNGVVYNALLTRAIYPRFIGTHNEEQYTYALWDLTKQEVVASLENIISASSAHSDIFPIPRWSPDGSQFVFKGHINKSDHVEDELFLVNQDGQVKQLTHLYPYGGVLDNYSWSPNGKFIAMYLATQDVFYPKARVVVLDTMTLDIYDYCFIITYGGVGYGSPSLPPPVQIWSPDSTQFLIMDQSVKNKSSVILVDIVNDFAVKIAEDMQPVGWMVSP